MEKKDDFETVLMRELPESLRARGAARVGSNKWKWLHQRIVKLTLDMPVARFRLPNKKEAQSAQSSINGTTKLNNGTHVKKVFPAPGLRFFTRTDPVASNDGEYFLYVGIEPINNKKYTTPPPQFSSFAPFPRPLGRRSEARRS